tara:strand:- start:45 stop:458 length:414 start_codon:yes stop_codon:yes gene_type:complete
MPKRNEEDCECDGCKHINALKDPSHETLNERSPKVIEWTNATKKEEKDENGVVKKIPFPKCRCNGCKKDNFIHFAQRRTTRILRGIRMLGNLSNKSHYAYEYDQASQIISAIREELREVEKRFKLKDTKKENPFRFK